MEGLSKNMNSLCFSFYLTTISYFNQTYNHKSSQMSQISRVALCIPKSKVVHPLTHSLTHSLTQWVTRSPFELFRKAKKILFRGKVKCESSSNVKEELLSWWTLIYISSDVTETEKGRLRGRRWSYWQRNKGKEIQRKSAIF